MLCLDLSSVSGLRVELERLNSEPCACFSGFISLCFPSPSTFYTASAVCPSSRRSRRSLMATFLLLALSAPFLGFEEEEPLSQAALLGEADPSFCGQLFPLLATGQESRLTRLRAALLHQQFGSGGGIRTTLLGENEARGLKSICAGLESLSCHFPGQSFCQSPVCWALEPQSFPSSSSFRSPSQILPRC